MSGRARRNKGGSECCRCPLWLFCVGCFTLLLVASAGLLYADVQFLADLVPSGAASNFGKALRDVIDQSLTSIPADPGAQVNRTRGTEQIFVAQPQPVKPGNLRNRSSATSTTAPLATTEPVKRMEKSRPTPSPTPLLSASTPEPTVCAHLNLVKYWKTLPKDKEWVSPFAPPAGSSPKYVTFDPDHAQWNNKRMAMETVVVMASALGRTLVMPPMSDKTLHFEDILQFDGIDRKALRIISMKRYLQELPQGLTKPPAPIVQALSRAREENKLEAPVVYQVSRWMKSVGYQPDIRPGQNFMAFPTTPDAAIDMSNPRMRPFLQRNRKPLLINSKMRDAPVLHFSNSEPYRLLSHFYSTIYFESKEMDKYYKRLVRDSLRYRDTICCKAALIVNRLQEQGNGKFNAAHIRRNDFGVQYRAAILNPEQTVQALKTHLPEGELVYLATDETDKSFFETVGETYKLRFLKDFWQEAGLASLPAGMLGMIEMVIVSRAEKAFGTWWSTFTGHIFRMRGYSGRDKDSWYLMREYRNEMQGWHDIEGPGWWREWPTAWTLIDE